MPSTYKLHSESGSHGNFLPKKKRSSLARQHSQLSSAAQRVTQGPVKCHRPSHVQGDAVTTRVQVRPGSTAAWMCSCGMVSRQDGIRGGQSTDRRTTQRGGTRAWGAVVHHWWPLKPEPKWPRWSVGSTGTSGLRAGQRQRPAGGLGSAPLQLLQPEPALFFTQAGWGSSLAPSFSPSRFS